MDLHNFPFRLTTDDNFPIHFSPFSTYNLFKSTVLASELQSQESRIKDAPFRFPSNDKHLDENKNCLSSSPLFRYSHPDLLSESKLFDSVKLRRQRGEKRPIPDEQKDDRYYEKRRRNNQAAKKSRDARKFREDQIAMRAALLEHENAILRAQILTLREEAASLRQMLFQKKSIEIISRDSQLCIS